MEIFESSGTPLRVVIAGGGVAAIEAMLALRALARGRVGLELLAPERDFVYRPLWVAEPFGLSEAKRFEIDRIAADCDAHRRRAKLLEVDAGARSVLTSDGERLAYDALLLAIGTRAREALPGVLTFGGPPAVEQLRELIGELERGSVKHVAFVVPAAAVWSLPLYELALLTADHLRRRDVDGVTLTVVTHEKSPLAPFGRAGAERVRELLDEAEIGLESDAISTGFDAGRLEIADGRTLEADAVVALPRLEVPPIPGVTQNSRGFIATEPDGSVSGLNRVYAAGDATWFPVKQGGIATQQADAAAASIAALAGVDVTPPPVELVMRGALVTGSSVEYLRAENKESVAAAGALWWPPSKIAGRYLAPYLTRGLDDPAVGEPLADLAPYHAEDPEASDAGHREALALALEAADAEARWEDFDYALKWLDVAEQLNVVLPPEYVRRRELWRAAAGRAG